MVSVKTLLALVPLISAGPTDRRITTCSVFGFTNSATPLRTTAPDGELIKTIAEGSLVRIDGNNGGWFHISGNSLGTGYIFAGKVEASIVEGSKIYETISAQSVRGKVKRRTVDHETVSFDKCFGEYVLIKGGGWVHSDSIYFDGSDDYYNNVSN